jgi:gp46
VTLKTDQPTWIIYQGPPTWDGSKWVNGDRFFLSGPKAYRANLGVELAPGMDGLELPVTEYRYDADANTPGSQFVSAVATRRNIKASINIFGEDVSDLYRNKDRWYANHQHGSPGRLWFLTRGREPRYLSAMAAEGAGQGTIEKDWGLHNTIKGMEWGWTSDAAYFFGYREEKVFKPVGGKRYRVTFFNASTAPRVYPELYLPGPGQWEFSLGYEQPNLRTPGLAEGEVAKLDYNPKNPTFLKRQKNGTIVNLWPSMVGQRPRFCLEPQTMNTLEIRHVTDETRSGDGLPRLKYSPEFTSWT